MRALAAAGIGTRRPSTDPAAGSFRDFLDASLPDAMTSSVLVGTPGPAQKVTVELRDDSGAVVGYAKYGNQESAIMRLRAEFAVLSSLPADVGPAVLGFGEWADGIVLVTSPVVGVSVGTKLPPDEAISAYLRRLETGPELDLSTHPFVSDLLGRVPKSEQLLEPLAGRRWVVAIQHGDFVPWNVKRASDAIRAFDWEYGTVDGFPGLDLAFYWLQTLALIKGASPVDAFEATVVGLSNHFEEIGHLAAESLVRMTVVDAYFKARADGHPDTYPLQAWRKQLITGIA
jgi:hypothetical protein